MQMTMKWRWSSQGCPKVKGAEESGDERMTMKLGRPQMMRALEGMKM